jgi:tetratricopeptide (TPR) repeat protein
MFILHRLGTEARFPCRLGLIPHTEVASKTPSNSTTDYTDDSDEDIHQTGLRMDRATSSKSVLICGSNSFFGLLAVRLLAVVCFSSLLLMERAAAHGAYHDVVEEIRVKLQKKPDDAALRYRLAEAHAGHDEWQACLEELERVDRLAPGKYPTAYLRGLALHNAGKENEAKKQLDDFLLTNPSHVQALATRGRVFLKLGRASEAMVDLQKAVSLSSDAETDLITDLAIACRDAGKSAEASKVIDAGLKTAGNSPDLLQCALGIETAAGLWDAALGRIDALEKAAPRPEPWMAYRAELLQTAGRADESRAAWTALRAHLLSLPNLERGTPLLAGILAQAEKALGNQSPQPVIAPPKS